MNDATLNLCIWKSRLNGLSETCQTIHAEQKYILISTGFEFIQHIQPEFTALVFANPYAENIFPPVKIDAQNYICRFRDILMIFLDLVMNCIHKYKRIHCFKRSVLLVSYIRHYIFSCLKANINFAQHETSKMQLFFSIPFDVAVITTVRLIASFYFSPRRKCKRRSRTVTLRQLITPFLFGFLETTIFKLCFILVTSFRGFLFTLYLIATARNRIGQLLKNCKKILPTEEMFLLNGQYKNDIKF